VLGRLVTAGHDHVVAGAGPVLQAAALCMQNSDCPPALVQQMMTGDLKLARCMRSHGVPNFPDPTNGGSSGPVFKTLRPVFPTLPPMRPGS
jgi:hypothetical protein